MKKEIKAVVLAAGKSKRMKSDLSKVLHKILGKEIINFLLDNLVEAHIPETDIIIVAGPNLEGLKKAIHRDVHYAVQQNQLGTADALLSAQEYIKDFGGDLLVLAGDNPYITAAELKKLITGHQETNAQCTLLSAVFPSTPPPYGRIIRDENNAVTGVVEELDASTEQLRIREVNASIYLFANNIVFPLLAKIGNANQKGEYYLTDIIQILKERNYKIDAVTADDYYISVGINNRWELQEAQERFNQARLMTFALEKGVTILQPGTVTIEYGVEIGRDTVIYPSTYLAAGTKIGSHCRIGPFVYLRGVEIKNNEEIRCENKVS